MPNEIKFERACLYEEVWANPMRTLAKQYGLSDNGLRKICAALAIPLPKQGHWAKQAAGHRVSKTPLPAHTGCTVFVSRPPAPLPFEVERAAEREAVLQKALDRKERHVALVFDTAARMHAVVVPYERMLRESAKECEKAQKAYANPPKNPHWSNPSSQLANQYEYWLADGLELCRLSHNLPFRVTPSTWQRALTIINAIVKHAQAMKMGVESMAKPPRVVIKSGEVAIHLRIAEQFEAQTVKPSDKHSRTKQRVSTGKLRLFISHDGYGSSRQIDESSEERLESKSEEILSLMDRQFSAAQIADLVHKDRERQWKEQRERAEVEHRRREEERQRLQQEQARRDALEKEARNWDRAEKLRRYAAVLEGHVSTASGLASVQGSDFVSELREAAEFIDPVAERLQTFEVPAPDSEEH